MWDVAKDVSAAERREKELIADLWQPLIAEGAATGRFNNTASSAWQIVDELIALESPKNELLLQEEFAGQHKRLHETEAGKLLCSQFQKVLVEPRDRLKELTDQARRNNDPALAKSLQEERDKINAPLVTMLGAMWISLSGSYLGRVGVDHVLCKFRPLLSFPWCLIKCQP